MQSSITAIQKRYSVRNYSANMKEQSYKTLTWVSQWRISILALTNLN